MSCCPRNERHPGVYVTLLWGAQPLRKGQVMKPTSRVFVSIAFVASLASMLAAFVVVVLGRYWGGLIYTGAEAKSNKAFSLLLDAKYADALNEANQCVNNWPEQKAGYLARGLAFEALGNYSSADSDYSTLIALSLPDCPPECYAMRARARLQNGRHRGAAEDYARVVEVIDAIEADSQRFQERFERTIAPPVKGMAAPLRDAADVLQFLQQQRGHKDNEASVVNACKILLRVVSDPTLKDNANQKADEKATDTP